MPQRVADYFVVCGFNPKNAESLRLPGESAKTAPICDVIVLNANEHESVPHGYSLIDKTVDGLPADLNHGSFNAPCMYICIRRGKDKPPVVRIDIVTSENAKGEIIKKTPHSRSANINNSTSFGAVPLYLRLHRDSYSPFVITDLAVVIPSKGEADPLGYRRVAQKLNLGMVGSDVYLTFKLSAKSVNRASYRAELLARLPKTDHEDIPMAPMVNSVPIFALPSGVSLESWDKDVDGEINSNPQFSTFVLTTETSEKIYGASLAFLERFPRDALSAAQRRRLGLNAGNNEPVNGADQKEIYVSKAICLLSKHPFFNAFEAFLKFLYQMTISNSQQNISIERHISQFMTLPFPSPRCPRIHAHLSIHHQIHLSLPRFRPLPPSGASFSSLLWHLGTERVISLFHAVLTQQRVCVHSLHLEELTPSVEAVANLIFPLQWQCPFIPLCPIELASIIESPTPLMMGVSSTYFECPDNIPDESAVYLVSIDQGAIPDPEKKFKLIPARFLNPLMSNVKEIEGRLRAVGRAGLTSAGLLDDPESESYRAQIELDLRQAFLRCMCHLLGKYRSFLLPIRQRPTTETTDLNVLFDVSGFVGKNAGSSKTSKVFYDSLTSSQAFCAFIESRTFSGGHVGIQQHEFFDQCQDMVEKQPNPGSLLEAGTPNEEDTMKIVPPPEVEGEFKYSEFPTSLRSIVEVNSHKSEKTVCSAGQRTPQELKISIEAGLTFARDDNLWPLLLRSYYYALCLMYIPTYTHTATSATAGFREGLKVMELMGSERIKLPDEAPLRMILSACLVHHKPMTAVRVLNAAKSLIKQQINAATYSLYNQVLLEAKWPAKNRDGYTLWRLLKNTVSATVAFMEPLKDYRTFQSPPYENTFNLNMGLTHTAVLAKTGSSRSLEGAFQVSNTEEDCGKEKVFEPRTDSPDTFSVDTLNLKEEPGDLRLPRPDLLGLSQSNPNLTRSMDTPTPTTPSRSPPLIAAHPRSKAVASSKWSLSGSISKSLTSSNLGNFSGSPMKFFSSPKINKSLKTISDYGSSLQDQFESVTASPSFTKIKDGYNKYGDAFMASTKKMMENMDGKEGEENSSEDSLDDDGKRPSLPRRRRPNSADKPSSDATNSVKSGQGITPDIYVVMSAACTCYSCHRPLYEEEVMAGWTSDASNMLTLCPWCRKGSVPELSVIIEDRRGKPIFERITPMTFLSPIVLRKELETVLILNGEQILRDPEFFETHHMLFWNLYYAFEKMDLKHTLDQLLSSSSLLSRSDNDDDSGSHSLKDGKCCVSARLNWDSALANSMTKYPPLYRIYREFQRPEDQQNPMLVKNSVIKKDTLITIVESIKNNDCITPLMKLLYLFKTLNADSDSNTVSRRSCYREAQFLLIAAVGQKNIDFALFDIYWLKAHDLLQDHAKQLKMINDTTPDLRVKTCRKIFGEPSLLC